MSVSSNEPRAVMLSRHTDPSPVLLPVAWDGRGQVRIAEGPIAGREALLTPTDEFFFVQHGEAPSPIAADAWSLSVTGLVEEALRLSLRDLEEFPVASMPILLECAGSGRRFFDPPTPGTQLGNGTVACAEWTGVRLRDVLAAARPAPGAVEAVVTGADAWPFEPGRPVEHFAKGLPIRKALGDDVLLAWAMNGRPLSHLHGAPVRLVVADWFSVWSVKWLAQIEVVDSAFAGYWQTERYRYEPPEGQLVAERRVKSLITRPIDGASLARGQVRISGFAWAGADPVASVDVSVDGGVSWKAATLEGPALPHCWQTWNYLWEVRAPGRYALGSRAIDARGQAQPSRPAWNPLGYGNNGIQLVNVSIREAT